MGMIGDILIMENQLTIPDHTKGGRMPIKEGYDACLGYIDGVKSACCGHGVGKPFLMK